MNVLVQCLGQLAVNRHPAKRCYFIRLLAGVYSVTPLHLSALLIWQHTPSNTLFHRAEDWGYSYFIGSI